MTVQTPAATATVAAPEPPARRRRRFAASSLLGPLFSAPYLIFLAVIFAYPLGFAVYMSLHDYFFTAPGVSVERPFIGVENYVAALTDPAVRRSFVNVGIFLLINVPLTVVLSLVLATLLNQVVRPARSCGSRSTCPT